MSVKIAEEENKEYENLEPLMTSRQKGDSIRYYNTRKYNDDNYNDDKINKIVALKKIILRKKLTFVYWNCYNVFYYCYCHCTSCDSFKKS